MVHAPMIGAAGPRLDVQPPLPFYTPKPPTHPAPVRRDAPSTSREAARKIARDVPRLREIVLAAIINAGDRGLTDAEMQEQLDLAGNTQRPRRKELERLGLVVRSDRRRKTPSGSSAIVWTAAKFAGGAP